MGRPNFGGENSRGCTPHTIGGVDPFPPPPEHDSDCATHNEPAMPNDPCDCGDQKPSDEPPSERSKRIVDEWMGRR